MWKRYPLIALVACGFPRPPLIDSSHDGGIDADDASMKAVVDSRSCEHTACAGSTLEVCNPSGSVDHTEECALGCYSDGARCNLMSPSNGLAPALDEADQHSAITLDSGSQINTDTGVIMSAGRPITVATTTLAQSGGPFLRVFLARSWTIHDVRVRGALPVAFVSSLDITVQGMIDASADGGADGPGALLCGDTTGGGGDPFPGLFQRQTVGSSPGYPVFLWCMNGFGGGGFGTVGGAGGMRIAEMVGAGGQVNGNAELIPLRGGCEGGGGLVPSSPGPLNDLPPYRGAGGGAVQFVSGREVHIVAATSLKGIVSVGGGGGIAGALGHNDSMDPALIYGPGGGGAGGGILIEAPGVVIDDGAMLLAAGGGGGGYGACTPTPNGSNAQLGTAPASGGACPSGVTPSAIGGRGATTGVGEAGANATTGSAGSGGGGLGRIRINTADGQYSIGANAIVRGVATTGIVGRR
jgi:hypothetical protein